MNRYVFVGNRYHVLETMMNIGIIPIAVIAASGSYLSGELTDKKINFTLLENKEQLINILMTLEFDYLISNGCPYVIPVSILKKSYQTYINIHPSFLPSLRGLHPINGAILHNLLAGASCHIMDDGIDTGPIISRTEIPLTPEVDLGLLYQLSFMAEKDVFMHALKRNFIPDANIDRSIKSVSYYSRKEEDRLIDFQESTDEIIRRVKAFGINSQAAYFVFNDTIFYVLDAQLITNPYLQSKIGNYKPFEIVFNYNNNIVIKKKFEFIKFSGVMGDIDKLTIGKTLR